MAKDSSGTAAIYCQMIQVVPLPSIGKWFKWYRCHLFANDSSGSAAIYWLANDSSGSAAIYWLPNDSSGSAAIYWQMIQAVPLPSIDWQMIQAVPLPSIGKWFKRFRCHLLIGKWFKRFRCHLLANDLSLMYETAGLLLAKEFRTLDFPPAARTLPLPYLQPLPTPPTLSQGLLSFVEVFINLTAYLFLAYDGNFAKIFNPPQKSQWCTLRLILGLCFSLKHSNYFNIIRVFH